MAGDEILSEILSPFGKDKKLYIYPTSKYWRKIYIDNSDCGIYVSPSKTIDRVEDRYCISKGRRTVVCYTVDQLVDLYRTLCDD